MRIKTVLRAAAREFDYVIVGAGSAGCVLASRLALSKNADSGKFNRVLLLEAGNDNSNYLPIHVPCGYLHTINNPHTDWRFKTEPDEGIAGRTLAYPRGKGLGGCSAINGMIYMRGQAEDYDGWAESSGDERWRWEHMLRRFKKHENYRVHNLNPHMHGTEGPWTVEQAPVSWSVLDIFAEALTQSEGTPRSSDFNTGSNHGVGLFDVNQRGGLRLNA